MAVSSNTMLKSRSGLVVMSLLAFILVLAVGAYLWQAIEASSLSVVQAQISQLKPVLTSLRLLLIGLVALFWPTWIKLQPLVLPLVARSSKPFVRCLPQSRV